MRPDKRLSGEVFLKRFFMFFKRKNTGVDNQVTTLLRAYAETEFTVPKEALTAINITLSKLPPMASIDTVATSEEVSKQKAKPTNSFSLITNYVSGKISNLLTKIKSFSVTGRALTGIASLVIILGLAIPTQVIWKHFSNKNINSKNQTNDLLLRADNIDMNFVLKTLSSPDTATKNFDMAACKKLNGIPDNYKMLAFNKVMLKNDERLAIVFSRARPGYYLVLITDPNCITNTKEKNIKKYINPN